MENINLKEISKIISTKLNRTIDIYKIEDSENGFHSKGYKLISSDGQAFFLKKIKSHDVGFEYPDQKVASLIVSDGMSLRACCEPRPLGVIVGNGEDLVEVPNIDEDSKIFQIQEFESNGASYQSLLLQRKDKKNVDQEDLNELNKITDFISRLHKKKHPSSDEEYLKLVYNASLRKLITHPELALAHLVSFGDSHPILPRSKHGQYLELMLKLIYKWENRSDRLVALHGDFWGSNLFFKDDGSIWVIDYSRIPWGDRGIDVGWWLSEYLWLYHETQNKYFQDLGEKFLDLYIQKTGDIGIRQAVSLVMGLKGILRISPKFYPDLDEEIGRRFFINILEILKRNELTWSD